MDRSGLFSDHISLKVDNSRFKSSKDTEADFLLYLMDISYFSGKLEMYFRYRNFKFLRVEPTLSELFEIKKKTGTSQVPLVYDKIENVWLRDTTYIIKYMEEKYVPKIQRVPVYPSCNVQRFISLLLEDFADEYMWRPAMYMRWEPGFDSKVVSTRFVWEFANNSGLVALVPKFLKSAVLSHRQWLFSVFGEGIEDDEQHNIVKHQYYTVMDTLQGVLEKTPFLFGSHPTIVDFGFIGPFFRHFASDPTPRKIMQQQAPAVYEWVGRMWNCKQDRLPPGFESICPDGTIGNSWTNLFPLAAEYLHYLHENAVAWKSNHSSFKFLFKGGHSVAEFSKVQTVPYRVWCRLELQRRFNEIQDEDTDCGRKIKSLMVELNCWDLLWKDGMVECPPEFGTSPPYCIPRPYVPIWEDTPKWSFESLLMRYVKARLHILLPLFFLFLLFLYVSSSFFYL